MLHALPSHLMMSTNKEVPRYISFTIFVCNLPITPCLFSKKVELVMLLLELPEVFYSFV
jgi:hypothetical protein